MSLSPIDGIGAIVASELRGVTPSTLLPDVAGKSRDFTTWLAGEVRAADSNIRDADAAVRRLALGEEQNVHTVMLSIERAQLSFEFVVQVRNRLLEAYQDVMRMQV